MVNVQHLIVLFTIQLIIHFSLQIEQKSSYPLKKCRALALKGGGSKGAYEVGALAALIDALPQEETQYDVLSGVSIGSILAGALSLFEKGKEKEAIDILRDFTLNIQREDIWQLWDPLSIHSWFKRGFFDSTPLFNSITKLYGNRTVQREFLAQAIDLDNGDLVIFDMKGKNISDVVKMVWASSAVSVYFPPVEYNNLQLQDGGTFSTLNVFSAIHKCRELVEKDSDIIIDIVLIPDKPLMLNKEQIDRTKFKAFNFMFHQRDFFRFNAAMDDITSVANAFPDIKIRHLVTPSQRLPASSPPIFFHKEDLVFMYDLGYKDALEVIGKKNEYYQQFMTAIDHHQSNVLRYGF